MMLQPMLSVVVTTYNRVEILEKALVALLDQRTDEAYEVLVVDDGSTDATPALIEALQADHPHLRCVAQPNQGRARARNTGIREAKGEFLCYVDSDVVVVPTFVQAHLDAHRAAQAKRPGGEVFVQGHSVNVDDFDRLTEARVPPFDPSRAFFDTKNVSIRRRILEAAGGFDTGFVEYGWEDLELGVRLKAMGVGIVRSNEALGFHYHPAFSVADLPKLRRIEEERGRMAARFLAMHPTLDVRLMTQDTWFHAGLNTILTWGGLLNERTLRPVFEGLERAGHRGFAAQLAQIVLNQYNIRELRAALRNNP
jgi:glycosyltransferase involved in cell wall biosynthesis